LGDDNGNLDNPIYDDPDADSGDDSQSAPPAAPPDPEEEPERPQWLPKNFWNEKTGEANYEELAKSYANLRNEFNKRLSDKDSENAADYLKDIDLGTISEDDPALKLAISSAIKNKIGTKAMKSFLSDFISGLDEITGPKIDSAEEMQKLGRNAENIIGGVKTWLDGMLNKKDLDEESHNALLSLGMTAAGVKALNILKHKDGEIGIPVESAVTAQDHMTVEDWYNATYETHAEKGESMESYDKRMRSIAKKLFGDGEGTFDGSGYGTSLLRRRK
jgi:hypothetical protein